MEKWEKKCRIDWNQKKTRNVYNWWYIRTDKAKPKYRVSKYQFQVVRTCSHTHTTNEQKQWTQADRVTSSIYLPWHSPVQELNSKALFLRYWLTIYNSCQLKLNLIRFSVNDWNHRRYIGWMLARKIEQTQWWRSVQPYIWAIVYQKTYLYHLNMAKNIPLFTSNSRYTDIYIYPPAEISICHI